MGGIIDVMGFMLPYMLEEIGGGGLHILPFPLDSCVVGCVGDDSPLRFVVGELAVPDLETFCLTRFVLERFIASRISRARGGVSYSSTSVPMCPLEEIKGLNGESELEDVSEVRRNGILEFL